MYIFYHMASVIYSFLLLLISASILTANTLQTNNQASNAFDSEISHLNRCDKSKRKSAEKLPQSKRAKPGMLSKEFAAWNPGDRSSRKGGKFMRLNGKLAGKNSSTVSLPHIREKIASLFGDKYA